MTEAIWVAMIVATPPTLAVLVTARQQAVAAQKQSSKLEEVHQMANSRLTEALQKIEALNLLVERQRVAANKEGP